MKQEEYTIETDNKPSSYYAGLLVGVRYVNRSVRNEILDSRLTADRAKYLSICLDTYLTLPYIPPLSWSFFSRILADRPPRH